MDVNHRTESKRKRFFELNAPHRYANKPRRSSFPRFVMDTTPSHAICLPTPQLNLSRRSIGIFCPATRISLHNWIHVATTGGGSRSRISSSVTSKTTSEKRSLASLASGPSSSPSNSTTFNLSLFSSLSNGEPGGGFRNDPLSPGLCAFHILSRSASHDHSPFPWTEMYCFNRSFGNSTFAFRRNKCAVPLNRIC